MDNEIMFDSFVTTICVTLKEKYPEYDISPCETTKINSCKWNGVCIRNPKNSSSPIIYLDEFYQQFQRGRNIPDIVQDILEIYKVAAMPEDISAKVITTFACVKDRICYKLINKEKNKELLERIPHREFLDLAIVYYVALNPIPDGMLSVTVTNGILRYWGG